MPDVVIGIIFFIIGFTFACVGFNLGLIDVLKEDVAWGVIYLLVPLASLVFYFIKCRNQKIRTSFFVMIAGWLMTSLGGGWLQQASSSFQTSTTLGADINSSQNFSPESPFYFPAELNVSRSPTQASSPGSDPSPQLSQASVPPQKDEFKQSIKLGYIYYAQGDYQTALINFNKALQVRPGDACAVQAVNNTKSAIDRPRQCQIIRALKIAYSGNISNSHCL